MTPWPLADPRTQLNPSATLPLKGLTMTDPNVTDWLTAIGTVGTLGATVILFWWDRIRRQGREHRAQATLISGWTDSIRVNDIVRPLHLINMSDEPVYNTNVFMEDEDIQDQAHNIIEQPIDSNTRNKHFISVLPAKQHVTWYVSRRNPVSKGPRSVPRVGLLFNDRNGMRWLRNWDGKISPRPHDRPEFHRPAKASDVEPPTREWIT